MTSPRKTMCRLLFTFVMVFVALLLPTYTTAAPPMPIYSSADVDGVATEWNLATDFYADMYEAGNPSHAVLAKLYLRYHCPTNVLYALVLPEPGFQIVANGADAFLKLGNSTTLVNGSSGDNGIAPDFQWIGLSGGFAAGWEASTPLAVGNYNNLNPHTNVTGNRTAAVENRRIDLNLTCPPLAVTLASFEATARPADVLVAWETASETDNLGFNLYRSDSPHGERNRLNGEMIPSQVPGGGGALYQWADDNVSTPATYYYWLETVDLTGATQLHGPVSAEFPAIPTAVTVSTFEVTDTAPYALFAFTALALAGALLVLRRGHPSKNIVQ
jgi:hypothetical protein